MPDEASQASGILIVEDDEDSRDMLEQLARLYGYPATGVATASSALECAEQQLPKLALVDIGLADADGFEVARRIRELAGGGDVYLVALTGFSDSSSRQRARQAGFDEFVVKPLTPAKLQEMLAKS